MMILFNLFYSFVIALAYLNPFGIGSAYDTAAYFGSVNRDANSWENAELFETLGADLDLSMERNIHYAERPTYWTDIQVGEEWHEGSTSMMFEQPFEGEVMHLDWDDTVKDINGKVIVLPMTDYSLEHSEEAYTIDYFGVIKNDEEANRYLNRLAEAGAAGFIITPHAKEPENDGFVITSYTLPIAGSGVDLETAKQLEDGETVRVEPYKEEIPYVEFVQTGRSEQEVIIMSRLESTWQSAQYFSSVGPSTVLYELLKEMDGELPEHTIRYVFMNGNGVSKESSDDYLQQVLSRGNDVSAVILLDILGADDEELFIRTNGLKRYPFMEEEPFSGLKVRPLYSSPGELYDEQGLPFVTLSDSETAQWLNPEYDDLDYLSTDVLVDHVDWLKTWLLSY